MTRRGSLALLTVLGLALGLTAAGCASPSVEQGPPERYRAELSDDCSEDVVVVFARGSSQPRDIAQQPETRRFFEAIDEVFRREVTLGYLSVDYPATGGFRRNVEAYRNRATAGAYHESRSAGTRAAARFLNGRTAQCQQAEAGDPVETRQRYVLGGYSQGAHAMREALFELDGGTVDRVAYVALFGDPTFRDSAVAAGDHRDGAAGIFGGAAPQVPEALAAAAESYCDRRDFFCGGGRELAGVVGGQLLDLLRGATGQESEHALYPFDEMYQAAAENLSRRQLFGGPPRVDVAAGQFAGRYTGTAGCEWPGGAVGQGGNPGLLLYLTLDVYSHGTETTATSEVEQLTAELRYENTPDRSELGRARLAGSASDGRVDLAHQEWLSGGRGVAPLDIVAEATAVLREDGPIAESDSWVSLATPLAGHQGCFYRLERATGDD